MPWNQAEFVASLPHFCWLVLHREAEWMMRFIAAAAVVLGCVAVATAAGPHAASSIADTRSYPHHLLTPIKAEGGKPDGGSPPRGNDNCQYANDHECDEPDIGTGACRMNTDYSDCVHLRTREDDSCQYAHDGECDEPNFGSGACTQGTDRSDCGNIAWLRNQNDSCATAFNGVCEEPGRGNSSCRPRTDRADCLGRNRPMAINDHFFGHDDRVLVPVNQPPWRFIGSLNMDRGSECTATLIAPNVIVTAAHCINEDNGVEAPDGQVRHHARAQIARRGMERCVLDRPALRLSSFRHHQRY